MIGVGFSHRLSTVRSLQNHETIIVDEILRESANWPEVRNSGSSSQ